MEDTLSRAVRVISEICSSLSLLYYYIYFIFLRIELGGGQRLNW